jgi:hypothetical protein
MKTAKEAFYHQGLFRYSEKGWPENYREKHLQGFETPTPYSEELYQQALSLALEESIPFEDQRAILQMLDNKPTGTGDATGLYTFPEQEIEIVNCCAYDACTMDGSCEHCREPQDVVRIKPSLPSPAPSLKPMTLDNKLSKEDIIRKHSLNPAANYSDSWILKVMEEYATLFNQSLIEEVERFKAEKIDLNCAAFNNGYELEKAKAEIEHLKEALTDLTGCTQLLNSIFKWAKVKDGRVTFTTSEETWNTYKKFVSDITALSTEQPK